MPPTNSRAVLITGASSGIGEACVQRFDQAWWRVFGTVRSERDEVAMREKFSERVTPIRMDVTDAGSITAAAAFLRNELAGIRLAGLINNAGISIGGPMEVLPLDEVRRLFEVNVFGHVAVTQALIPLLRQAKGRIVFIGSIAGLASFPYNGAYSMTKWSLEALAEALRVELRPFGMRVSIVEPGSIDTPIWQKGAGHSTQLLEQLGQYREHYEKPVQAIATIAQRAAKMGIPPDRVAKSVEHAITARWPRTHYVVGWDARLLVMIEALPDWLRDWLVWTAIQRMAGD